MTARHTIFAAYVRRLAVALIFLAVQAACGSGSSSPTAPSDPTSATDSASYRKIPRPRSLTYSANPAVYKKDVPITNNTPTVTGPIASYSVSPALPAGLILDAVTGVISVHRGYALEL